MGKELFGVYRQLTEMAAVEFNIECSWRFYKDGNAWLCKAVFKKKTVFWLSVWDGFIKTSFFFTEKTRTGVMELPIKDGIKKDFEKSAVTGKLIALILDIDRSEQLADFREVVKYKKSLK